MLAQTFALDTGLMIEEFIRSQGTMPRGLAHPIIFDVSSPPPFPYPYHMIALFTQACHARMLWGGEGEFSRTLCAAFDFQGLLRATTHACMQFRSLHRLHDT